MEVTGQLYSMGCFIPVKESLTATEGEPGSAQSLCGRFAEEIIFFTFHELTHDPSVSSARSLVPTLTEPLWLLTVAEIHTLTVKFRLQLHYSAFYQVKYSKTAL